MGSKPEACLSSGVNTCSGTAALVVSTTAGWLCGINVIVASTGDINIIAYDSAAASGTVLYRRKLDSSAVLGAAGGSRVDVFPVPINYSKGLTLTCTGTAPDGAIAWYANRG